MDFNPRDAGHPLAQCHDNLAEFGEPMAWVPDVLEEASRLMKGPWIPGYASEFAAYAGYAKSHPETFTLDGSYGP